MTREHVFKIRERHQRYGTDYAATCTCGWTRAFEYRIAANRAARDHVRWETEQEGSR